jgi:hemoglobin-like flavoprotein
MGSASSTSFGSEDIEVINLMMPLYYIPNPQVTLRDTTACLSVWNAILDDASPSFILKKNEINFKFHTCREWFYHTFYERLFDIHPLCKPLFVRGVDSIGVFLVQMISMSLNQCEDPLKFQKSMKELAERHCERGVKAVEYGIIGDVLFYSLEATAGGLYSPAVEGCWKKVFSSMLAIIVPLCIRYERKGKMKNTTKRETTDSSMTRDK